MKPILKWAGGKTALLPELVKRMPKSYGRYHEPFVGGGALFFHLEPTHHGVVLSDTNYHLIDAYRAIRDSADDVSKELRKLERKWSAKHYYQVRWKWNLGHEKDLAERTAMFLYLNRTCYNGLYRENKAGAFNVPVGRYKHPHFPTREELEAASKALSNVRLFCRGFVGSLNDTDRGDFVYCDPPYDPISKTASFTAYQAGGFGWAQQEALEDRAAYAVKRGVKVMLSNHDTPRIRKLYASKIWKIERVSVRRSISCAGARRRRAAEVIITGGY